MANLEEYFEPYPIDKNGIDLLKVNIR